MAYDNLLLSVQEHVATITINNPKSLNALNSSVLQDLEAALMTLANDDQVRAIILTGAERAFVAGADIAEMATLNEAEGRSFGAKGAKVFRLIETLNKPVLAAINGFALGGGCELAMACDIRLASVNAKFGQPEVGLGIIPGFSGTQRLARLVGAGIAKELIYTGSIISADEALRIGLVNHVYDVDELMPQAEAMAQLIAKQAPIAVRYAKQTINDGWDMPMDQAIDLESDYFGRCFNTNDQKRGMQAFMNKEKVQFEGK